VTQKERGEIRLSPKTGRPKSQNPKDITVKGRIDAETYKRLMEYCETHNVTVTDVVRKGIDMVLEN
jgi:NRPS condensation-like uncharacterized protein